MSRVIIRGLWEPRCIKQISDFLERLSPGKEEKICDPSVSERKDGILLERCAITADELPILPAVLCMLLHLPRLDVL